VLLKWGLFYHCTCATPVVGSVIMQILSVLIGLACAVPMAFGLIPLFGWVQWMVLVGCVVGIIFGSFCERKIGLVINVAVAVVAVLRLFLGGGVF
jgi:hypothetical protein